VRQELGFDRIVVAYDVSRRKEEVLVLMLSRERCPYTKGRFDPDHPREDVHGGCLHG
jgi:hypothetical protein